MLMIPGALARGDVIAQVCAPIKLLVAPTFMLPDVFAVEDDTLARIDADFALGGTAAEIESAVTLPAELVVLRTDTLPVRSDRSC